MLTPVASSAGEFLGARTPASCSTRSSRPCTRAGLSRAAVSCTIATGACNPGSSGRRNTLTEGVAMRAGKRRSDRALRAVLPRSPGRPGVAQRESRRRFWAAIAVGRSSEAAAIEVGVSPAVGARWVREAGGMSPRTFAPSAKPPSERYLSFAEREELALLRARGCGVRETARRLGRAASTISRELRRNAATRSGGLEYRATTAQWHAERAARRPKPAKLAVNAPLRGDVQERLAGEGGGSGRGGGRGAGGGVGGGGGGGRGGGRGGGGGAGAGRARKGPGAGGSAAPPVGQGVEPGADRPPLAARLPRG